MRTLQSVFRHASIYRARERSPEDGFRVLIMRQWPRGIRKEAVDLWMKDAAPSRPLLDAYHHAGLPCQELAVRYRAEILEERPQVLSALRDLEREHGIVTVLCFERLPPADYCHRLTLLELLATSPTVQGRHKSEI